MSVFQGIAKKWKYTAVDECGKRYFYTVEPKLCETIWFPVNYMVRDGGFIENCPDWKQSLEKRTENEPYRH